MSTNGEFLKIPSTNETYLFPVVKWDNVILIFNIAMYLSDQSI